MNRTYVRILSVAVLLSILPAHSKAVDLKDAAKAGEKTDHAKKDESSDSSSTRTKDTSKNEVFPAKYDELLAATKKEIKFKALKGDTEKAEFTDELKTNSKFLWDQVKVLKDYRDKINSCSGSYNSEKELSKVLDSYISELHTSLTKSLDKSKMSADDLRLTRPEASVKDAEFVVSERVINTTTLKIREILEAKAKKHEKSKADFEAEDKKLSDALNKIAGHLWNGKEDGKFRETVKMTEDDSTKAISEATDKVKAALDKQESACKIIKVEPPKEEVKPSPSPSSKPAGSKKDEGGPEKVENPAVSPSPEPTTGGGNTGGGNTGGGNTGGGNTGGGNAGINPGAGLQDQNNLANLLGLGNLDNLLKQLQDQQRFNDQLAQQALNQNNDILGKALQALGQIQPPDGARTANRENSEGGFSPAISPSLETGKGGAQQPNIPPPQYQPPPPIPQLPLSALQPPPAPVINFPSYDSKKFDDELIRRPPVAVQDPKTTGLLELLKFQQQMLFQAQQQRGMSPYGNVGNVNTVGGRLSGFAARGRTRGRVAAPRTGGRMNGTASSGLQARMGANSRARTQAPK